MHYVIAKQTAVVTLKLIKELRKKNAGRTGYGFLSTANDDLMDEAKFLAWWEELEGQHYLYVSQRPDGSFNDLLMGRPTPTRTHLSLEEACAKFGLSIDEAQKPVTIRPMKVLLGNAYLVTDGDKTQIVIDVETKPLDTNPNFVLTPTVKKAAPAVKRDAKGRFKSPKQMVARFLYQKDGDRFYRPRKVVLKGELNPFHSDRFTGFDLERQAFRTFLFSKIQGNMDGVEINFEIIPKR